jgi:DNA processing protein
LLAWKTLQAVKGLGNGALSRLVLRFGSPEGVQAASLHELTADEGVSHSVAKRIQGRPDSELLKDLQKERQSLEQGKFSIVTILDPIYPPRLKMIPDPPPLLYMTGNLQVSDHQALAIVGSRKSTPTGWALTRQLSGNLAALGFTIVSGLARGVDAAAHQGAIEVGGRTIAVLGCGIDRTYPSEHKNLRQQIEAHGGVLSEFPPGTAPRGHHFPERNRVISGISMGVVVTEAAAQSGSLVTARLAAEQDREVFAVPGTVNNPMSRGPHLLIKQGAKLVEGPEDILEELLPQLEAPFRNRISRHAGPSASPPPQLGQEEETLYNFISLEPTSLEDVISQTSFAPAEVMSILLTLEIKGVIRQLPGARYIRAGIQ